MISALYSINVPKVGNSKTTFNVGTIEGGTSVNTIAQEASMTYEYRSDNKECLEKMKNFFNRTIEMFKASGVEIEVELLGERPCMSEMKDPSNYAKLKQRAIDSMHEITGLEVIEGSSSTDCNIPFSMGISAVCFGVVRSAGAHTREEKLEIASLYDGCRLLLNFLYKK
jgi:acetylornithine deacetylase/succinyl-diaminopimelate desuccinylase-like protein